MRMLLAKPTGYLCLGDQFCWPVHGWRPNRFQRLVWRAALGVTWKDAA